MDVPVLVLHGDSDAIVPLEASGAHVAGAQVVVIARGPHGINASRPREFDAALLELLGA